MFEIEQTKLLVAVAFHYVESRLAYLFELLKALGEYPCQYMHVVLQTNTGTPSELAKLEELLLNSGLRSAEVRQVRDLQTPWHLTWAHKSIISDEFVGCEYTHFIYTESDVLLSSANFRYWLTNRTALYRAGLIPSFLRFEWSNDRFGIVSSDLFWPVYAPFQPHLISGQSIFVSVPNPYNPFFVLDQELAEEYVASPAIDPVSSESVCNWGLAERSAMGLCLVNVPHDFPTRYVVEVDTRDFRPAVGSMVRHMPDNYANNPRSALGKVSMTNIIADTDQITGKVPFRPFTTQFLTEVTRRFSGECELSVALTEHDTILYYDPTGVLRHLPLGLVNVNLVLQRSQNRVRLIAREPDSDLPKPLMFGPDAPNVTFSNGGEWLQSPYFSDCTVAIVRNGIYLGADLDGLARLNRPHCLQWERFRMLPVERLVAVAALAEHPWVDEEKGVAAQIAPQPFAFRRSRGSEASALVAHSSPAWADRRRLIDVGVTKIDLEANWSVELVGDELRIFSPTGEHIFAASRADAAS